MNYLVERLRHISNAMGSFGSIEREAADRIEQLKAALRKAQEALEPFAYVADHDIGESETDNDIFRPMSGGHNIAPLTVGDLRRSRDAIAEIEKVLK